MADPRRHFAKVTILVDGVKVEIDTDASGLPIVDLSQDMDRVASQMAWWGSVLGAAEQEKITCDAAYRRWRGQRTQELLGKDPKMAEWKLRAAIDADPKFIQYKQAIAAAERHVVLVQKVFAAFDKKANLLQSKGAMARAQLDATGMSTPREPRSAAPDPEHVGDDPDSTSAADKVAAMRRTNQSKKKR